jgi:hypothetical protein
MKTPNMLETPKALSTFAVTILKMKQWAISRDSTYVSM